MHLSKRSIKKSSSLKKAGAIGLTAGKWLFEFLGVIVDAMPNPLQPRYVYMRGWPDELPRHRIYGEVRRMKERGWIQVAEKQGKKFIKLTNKGRLEIFYRKLQSLGTSRDVAWDGTWWFAFYDIPERGRNERHAIRDALHLAGFYLMQKSVYVYPHKIPQDLIAYLSDAKLLSFIRFVHVDHMDGSLEIEKHFLLRRTKKRENE